MRGRAVAAAALLLLGSCRATVSGELPAPAPRVATGSFRAAAARVDITPVPGYPLGGHSVSGTIARGHWTRLHARTLYLDKGRLSEEQRA